MSVKYSSILIMVMYSRTILQLRESGWHHWPGGTSHGRQRRWREKSVKRWQAVHSLVIKGRERTPANIPTHHQSFQHCIPVTGTPSERLLQCCCLYSPSVFTTPLNEHWLVNTYFRVHTANISLRHWDYLFYNLIDAAKILAEYKECVLNQPRVILQAIHALD